MKYIDLGLPSGTLWADTNKKGFFTFDEAVEKFGKNLPKRWQWCELQDECKMEWDDERGGYTVTGPNGNSIFLPAMGYKHKNRVFFQSCGFYWSSSPYSAANAYLVYFHSGNFDAAYEGTRYYSRPVRFVK